MKGYSHLLAPCFPGLRAACLTILGRAMLGNLVVISLLASVAGGPYAQDGETAEEVFHDHISGPIVQSRCVNCHVEGGVSGHTRLVLVRSSDAADHEALNLRAFEDLLDAVADEGGVTYVLNKIQGVSHGGGVQVAAGSAEFVNMQSFLGRLDGDSGSVRVALTPDTLFDTARLAPDWKTLRRAALIFAGRIPTVKEYEAVESGGEADLRTAIRGLMTGPDFHEFLVRASNDRLLTARRLGDLLNNANLVELTNQDYRHALAVFEGSITRQEHRRWESLVDHGVRHAPLELIAYVVENDRPYTEILTADYVMANPWAAKAYGASTYFGDPGDIHEFRPSRIEKYYLKVEGFEIEQNPNLPTEIRIADPGPLRATYPHAGVLNTISFLNRYPTTATNRNRARARWTYYHFLGVDIEKSASRTTDPVALADTNNPTMHNPNCTVCHAIMDPVAGAFQNYSDEGHYKIAWGGEDSLDELYKQGGSRLAIEAETWAQRDTLIWTVTLAAGVETLRVLYANHFWDEAAREGGKVHLDRLDVVDANGEVIASQEFESLPSPVAHWGNCGQAESSNGGGPADHFRLWSGYIGCAFYIDVEVPATGAYDVEVLAWSGGRDERYNGDEPFAELSVDANGYEEGDTWYRDMRTPGFDGMAAPNSDNSVQWLARRIVADDRFAEATVKFWWPAIMGSEIAEFPEESSDADFEGRLLAANAQDAEVVRLASGFRRGFRGGRAYNLKDLLAEIVLSKWFRAVAVADADPVRRVALRDAGARRLLTPEELTAKTAAITGVQWGRETGSRQLFYFGLWPSELTANFRLLYGGIDSEGITERARDMTSVMAGVAKRHAVEVACPVVLRDFYLVPEAQRRLFGGIEPTEQDAAAVRAKLVELHDKLLGVRVDADSADVAAAYRLFVEVSKRGKAAGITRFEWWRCNSSHDDLYLDGILDGIIVRRETGGGWTWDEPEGKRWQEFMSSRDYADPHHAAQAWVVVLTALLMDYRYLYL